MHDQINRYQRRLYYKLFATLPSVKKTDNFNFDSNFNLNINSFNYFRNKDFWFAKTENEDRYIFLFGIRDKPVKDICGNDTCLVIDFDKNIQFSKGCLGIFAIKNSDLHVLINVKLLKEKYPKISVPNFKINNFKSFDNSLNLEVFDLGKLDGDFIENLEKLVKASSSIKSKKESNPQKINNDSEGSEERSKMKNDFKINHLREETKSIEEKPAENIIHNNFKGTNEKQENDKKLQSPRLIKDDSSGNQITVNRMNTILVDLANGKNEEEAISNASVSKTTYQYWIHRGKQEFGDVYVQFYNYINELKSTQNSKPNEIPKYETSLDMGIYEPILEEYEESFDSINKSGIAWVKKNGLKWYYSRNINGKLIRLSANTIPELYEKVINENLIWGIRDYDRAKEFMDFPDDFEIPLIEIEGELDKIDQGIYAPLSEEYENSFSSMNKSGIAWVNQIGNKLYYMKSVNGKSIRISGENVYDLYNKVIGKGQIWGIRDYDRAKEFIDIPDDFEISLKHQVEELDEEVDVEVDPDIYAPLSEEYENSLGSMNKSGIAWVTQIGNKLYYMKSVNGKSVRISAENIYKLYDNVKKSKNIWGIRDYNRAKKFIDIPNDFEIPTKQETESVSNNEIDESIYAPLSKDQLSKFNPNPNNKSGIAWVNKVGNNWSYQRQRNGKIIRITDPSIIKLHEKVINNNQVWGIFDIEKARKVIELDSNDKKDFENPLDQENELVSNKEIDKSIYAPLSRDQLSKFNPNPNNKSGIAWVSKVGNNWCYKRQRNGKIVKFTDPSIIKLHEKVINNNQVWGIFDIEKARKVIESDSIGEQRYSEPPKESKPINIDSKVTVTYIEKPMNEFEILIKGNIRNRDLIDVLIRLELFKENIKRIITHSLNKESDIFIELVINKYLLHAFEEKIEDLGWKIIK